MVWWLGTGVHWPEWITKEAGCAPPLKEFLCRDPFGVPYLALA